MTSPFLQSDADLEHAMTEMGRARFRNRVAQSAADGRRSDTGSGRAMLRKAVQELEGAVRKFQKAAAKRAGVGHSSAPLLEGLPPGAVALVAARTVVDGIALQTPLAALAANVGAAVEDEARFTALKRAASGARLADAKGKTGKNSVWPDLRRRLKRHARGDRAKKRAMAKQVAAKVGADWPGWSRRDKIRLGVLLVEMFRVHTGLVEIVNVPRDGRRPHAVVVPTAAALNWLEQLDAQGELLSPVYLPMRSTPADWTDAWTGGYRTERLARRPVVKARDKRTVAAVEAADPRTVFRAASAVQRTAWRVNAPVLDVARALWDSGAPVAGFQERIDDRPPARPEFPTEAEAARFIRQRADWRKRFHQNRGRRVAVARTMHLAQQHRECPAIYFPHQADFRGRLYPVPFFLQPQGDDLARGLLQFAKGSVVRDREAADWFRGAGAGHFGVNRVAQHKRVEWAHREHDRILAAAADPLGFRWWAGAESPFQFLAWCLEYAAWSREPARFESRIPVHLDGSCNGLQLYSLLVRDEVGGASTNVVPADAPRDIYQDVADRTTARLLQDTDEMAAKWLEFLGGSVPRGYVKRPTMTQVYGSTFHSAVNYTRDAYEADRAAGRPTPFEELSGGGYRACSFLAAHAWAAIGETVGRARAAMDWLRAVADAASAMDRPLEWTSPSGWPVVQRYTKYADRRIQTAVGDSIRFVRYREDRDGIAAKRQANGIAPNFIHSLDAAILALAVVDARKKGVQNFAVVHDSFGVPAADAELMSRTLRNTVADVFKWDLLAAFRDQVLEKNPGIVLPPLPEYGSLDPEQARGARYFYA